MKRQLRSRLCYQYRVLLVPAPAGPVTVLVFAWFSALSTDLGAASIFEAYLILSAKARYLPHTIKLVLSPFQPNFEILLYIEKKSAKGRRRRDALDSCVSSAKP